MLHSLDVSRLEAAERDRSSFPEGAGGDGPTVVNANIQMRGLDRDIRLAGNFQKYFTFMYCIVFSQ